jgi:hypothetical protein
MNGSSSLLEQDSNVGGGAGETIKSCRLRGVTVVVVECCSKPNDDTDESCENPVVDEEDTLLMGLAVVVVVPCQCGVDDDCGLGVYMYAGHSVTALLGTMPMQSADVLPPQRYERWKHVAYIRIRI